MCLASSCYFLHTRCARVKIRASNFASLWYRCRTPPLSFSTDVPLSNKPSVGKPFIVVYGVRSLVLSAIFHRLFSCTPAAPSPGRSPDNHQQGTAALSSYSTLSMYLFVAEEGTSSSQWRSSYTPKALYLVSRRHPSFSIESRQAKIEYR